MPHIFKLMKKDDITKLKTQKYFKKADIFAYLSLAILIVALFWVFVFSATPTSLSNLKVLKSTKTADVLIFDYEFSSGSFKIADGYENLVNVTKNSDGLLVTIYTSDNSGFNKIQITENEAFVIDANCSFHQDCMTFPHIKSNDNVIICVPHNLTLIGVGKADSGTDDPIIG
ncbi:MAG: NusG domain II-containing protein [Clostridia bacterium]